MFSKLPCVPRIVSGQEFGKPGSVCIHFADPPPTNNTPKTSLAHLEFRLVPQQTPVSFHLRALSSILQFLGLLLLLSSTTYLATFSSSTSSVLPLLVNDQYLPVIMARNKPVEDTQVPRRLWADDSLEFEANVEKAGSTAHRKKSRSAESSTSHRPGTPDSLGHMNEDGVAPHLDDAFGELEQDRTDTKILSAGARVKSEADLDLYAFFDGLSRAEKAKVLKPLMAKSGLKPSKEVHPPPVTSDPHCQPFDVNESHESLKKQADRVLRKQGDRSTLMRERSPVGPEKDIWGEDVLCQETDKAWSDPWTAPVVIHQDKSWEQYSKPWKQHRSSPGGTQANWAFPGILKADSWGSDDRQHMGGLAAYSGKFQAHSNPPLTNDLSAADSVIHQSKKFEATNHQPVEPSSGTMTEAHEKKEKDKAARKAEREAKADAEEIARLQARVESIHNAGREPEQNACQWSGMDTWNDAADPSTDAPSFWGKIPALVLDTIDDASVEDCGGWSAPSPSPDLWDNIEGSVFGDQEVAPENSQPRCKSCDTIFDPNDWSATSECCPTFNGHPYASPDSIESVNDDAAEGSAASEWGFDHGNPNEHKLDPTAPFKVNYWIHLESVNEEIYIPIDSKYVSGPEKHVIEGNMQKVWKWAQDKHMCDKLSLEDAFDLAKVMTDDSIDEAAKEEVTDGPKEGSVKDTNDTQIDTETGLPTFLKELVQKLSEDAGAEPVADPETATTDTLEEMHAKMLRLTQAFPAVFGANGFPSLLFAPPVLSQEANPPSMVPDRSALEEMQAKLLLELQEFQAECIANGISPLELDIPILSEEDLPPTVVPRLASLKQKLDDLAEDGVPVPAYDDDGKLIFCKDCLELRWECTCETV
jgi:hypothetical protein